MMRASSTVLPRQTAQSAGKCAEIASTSVKNQNRLPVKMAAPRAAKPPPTPEEVAKDEAQTFAEGFVERLRLLYEGEA